MSWEGRADARTEISHLSLSFQHRLDMCDEGASAEICLGSLIGAT
jgi:hypothetical protein